jgi:hypothetical protein
MNKKIILIFIVVIVVFMVAAAVAYWALKSNQTENISPEDKALADLEASCKNSGGSVISAMCCGQTENFPNLCLIGACGCSPESSHQVKICDCPPGKCFNGSECVAQ